MSIHAKQRHKVSKGGRMLTHVENKLSQFVHCKYTSILSTVSLFTRASIHGMLIHSTGFSLLYGCTTRSQRDCLRSPHISLLEAVNHNF